MVSELVSINAQTTAICLEGCVLRSADLKIRSGKGKWSMNSPFAAVPRWCDLYCERTRLLCKSHRQIRAHDCLRMFSTLPFYRWVQSGRNWSIWIPAVLLFGMKTEVDMIESFCPLWENHCLLNVILKMPWRHNPDCSKALLSSPAPFQVMEHLWGEGGELFGTWEGMFNIQSISEFCETALTGAPQQGKLWAYYRKEDAVRQSRRFLNFVTCSLRKDCAFGFLNFILETIQL